MTKKLQSQVLKGKIIEDIDGNRIVRDRIQRFPWMDSEYFIPRKTTYATYIGDTIGLMSRIIKLYRPTSKIVVELITITKERGSLRDVYEVVVHNIDEQLKDKFEVKDKKITVTQPEQVKDTDDHSLMIMLVTAAILSNGQSMNGESVKAEVVTPGGGSSSSWDDDTNRSSYESSSSFDSCDSGSSFDSCDSGSSFDSCDSGSSFDSCDSGCSSFGD